MSVKVDFHTHSKQSHDGGISLARYRKALNKNRLDYIAVTDHNELSYAKEIASELGNKIIVGEEINTLQGEIIGLFLKETIQPNQDIKDTIAAIRAQGGLIYIPHPFETVRKGLNEETLDSIKNDVDIVEVNNGRAFFQNFGEKASKWAAENNVTKASGSDAHRGGALGKTYTKIDELPKADNLLSQLKDAKQFYTRPSFFDIIAPKMNKLKKFFRG